jgi:hypothetical protein
VPIQVLALIAAVSASFTAVHLTDRERYVHEFRGFDLSFLQARKLEEGQKDPSLKVAYRDISKVWLRRSQDFRRIALYLSFISADLIVVTLLFLVSFGLDYLVGGILWLPPFALGWIFALAGGEGWLIRYRFLESESGYALVRQIVTTYEKASWEISKFFPPLLPPLDPRHLARWPEVEEAINEEMRAFLSSLQDTRELSMFGLQ